MMRLYRLALLLLPPAFRRRFGASLADEAEATLREAPSARSRAVAAVRLWVDLAASVAREWGDAVEQVTRNGRGGEMGSDLRWALRALGRTPGFSAAVVVTLGLGIGATTVALGLVDAYLLRALPYPEGDRLVAAWPSENWSREMIHRAERGLPSLTDAAGAGGAMLVLQEGDEPEELFATLATVNLHGVLGVEPFLGRGFLPEDGRPDAEPVVVLSHGLWRGRFGGDPEVLGRSIALGGEGHLRRTVVGVMPEGYRPLLGESVDAWIPVVLDPALSEYGDSYFMRAVGRLAPGATPEAAERDVRSWARERGADRPEWFTEERVARASAPLLAHQRASDRRTPLLAGLGAALLVLLVACANVANLMVARTTGRARELSVRAALGSSRMRTARTVLAEVAVLALAGAGAGLGLAALLVRTLERRVPEALPEGGLHVDPAWGAAALGLAVLAAGAAGLVPALQAARRDPAGALAGGRGSPTGRRSARVQRALTAAQLALATAGIAAMALLGRSLVELGRVDPGFAPSNAITFRLTAPPAAYPGDADVARFFREARAALAEVPGVESVGFGSRLPMTGGDSRISVQPEGWEFAEGEPRPVVWHRLMTPGYLEALGARLLEGRIPATDEDREGLPLLVVVNRAAARAFWPDEPAVGKRFQGRGDSAWTTVAGVVEDVRESGQAGPVLPALYIPHRDWPWRSMHAVVRGRQDVAALLPALKEAVWSVAPGVPVSRVETLEQVAERGLRPTRALTVLAAVAGTVTLLLGALGIYGVTSQAVARRVREIGVRAALGAGRGRLLRHEMLGATRIVVTGVGTGLVLAWLAGRALQSSLFGVGALDVPAFAAATALLACVAYLAVWLPARRASMVDPARVIREE